MRSDLERLIRDSNPVPDPHRDARPQHAEATLRAIVAQPPREASPRAAAQRRPVRWAIAVAVVVLAAAVLAVPGLFPRRASNATAATPPALTTAHAPRTAGAAESLRRIAAGVATLPDDTGSGDTASVTIRSWSLFTRVDGRQVTSRVVPELTVTRTRADGTASIERRYLEDGQDSSRFVTHGALPYPLRGLSPDDTELASQLSIGQPASNGTAGRFDSIVVANRQMPLEPAARAAVLRYLAASPGVQTVGAVTDRAGREGVGFTTDSDHSGLPTRYLLIISATTGKLLAYEETLTTRPGRLNVKIPSVIGYQIFESSRYVD